MNSIVIPFLNITVPINTLLGLALFLLIFFTFFSISFKLNVGEGDETSHVCNRRLPNETSNTGKNRSSWTSGFWGVSSNENDEDPESNENSENM